MLNCVNGEDGSSCERSSAPLVYCSACELVLSFAGATENRTLVLRASEYY